jgi:hypothetical protein
LSRALTTATERRAPETKESLSRGLNARQKAFAEARARGYSLSKATRLAGYNPSSSASAKAMGYALARDAQIARLVAHLAKTYLAAATGVAARALVDVVEDPDTKPADKIKAAAQVLNRGGVPASQEYDVNVSGAVEHRASPTMNELRIRAGLAPLPEPPPGEVVDADFEPVAAGDDDWAV